MCGSPSGATDTYTLPTPIASKALGTNDAADRSQMAEVCSIVYKATELLSSVDDDVTRAQAVVDSLIIRKAVLVEFIGSHARLISSIHRVPVEVFTAIFLLCDTEGKRVFSPHYTFNYMPLFLSQVSKRWRAICLDFPQLWAKFSMRYEPSSWVVGHVGTFHSFGNLIKLFLTRSQSSSLTLELLNAGLDLNPSYIQDGRTNMMYSTYKVTFLQSIMQCFLEHTDQWKCVKLQLPAQAFSLLENTNHHFPLLEYLDLEMNNRAPLAMAFQISHSPLLTKVHLGLNVPNIHFQWSQLTQLRLHGGPGVDRTLLVHILRSASRLQDLEIEWSSISGNSSWSVTPVVLPNLQSLNVHYKTAILQYLECPQLVSYTLTDTYLSNEISEDIVSFLVRSQCSIRTFRFTGARLPAQGTRVGDWIAVMSQLEDLHVSETHERWVSRTTSPTVDKLLADLTYHSANNNAGILPALCSHLRQVTLDVRGFDPDLLVNMLESRSVLDPDSEESETRMVVRRPAFLRSATVVSGTSPGVVFSPDATTRLERLELGGMKLDIHGVRSDIAR